MTENYPETEIVYTVEVDEEIKRDSYTTDDVNDKRAAWEADVALAYAQHLAVDAFGFDGVDVGSVNVVRMGEPNDQYDETGGVSL